MIRLALRNCLRNTRRSVITGLSIFVAIFVVLIAMAFMYSAIDEMIKNERLYGIGDIRIRTEKYSEYEDLMPLQFYIEDFDAIRSELMDIDEVESVEASITTVGAFYDDGELKNTTVVGADTTSVLFGDEAILNEGRMPEAGKKEIVATSRFLFEHGLSVGDSITIVFKTASSGSNAATCKIVGSVNYTNAEYNGSLLVIPVDTIASIMHMRGGALEGHIMLKEGIDTTAVASRIAELLDSRGIEVEEWKEASNVYSILPIYDVMIVIIIALFFFIASTLVFNTMMMSVLERKREISTMVAIGFSRRFVVALFIVEGAIIGLFGGIIGLAVGKIVISIFGYYGLDLTMFGADAVEGWSFPNVLYMSLDGYRYIEVLMIELAVSVVAALLASLRIRKLEVAEALREES